ncbi:MAG: hypothetical protein J5819_08850 [Eubacterium sp.]|nr:hypothetical protein [Eubacterium sp.]
MDPVLSEEEDIEVNDSLLRELDKGIDDIEAGRYYSVEEAFDYITRKRDEWRNARVRSESVARSGG